MEITQIVQLQRPSLWHLPKVTDWTVRATENNLQENVHLWRAVSLPSKYVCFCLTFPQRQFTFEDYNKGLSVEGMQQSDIQVLKSKRSKRCGLYALRGFRNLHVQISLWSGEGGRRDWYFTRTAQGGCSWQLHGKSVACSQAFLSSETECIPIPYISAEQGKVTFHWDHPAFRPPLFPKVIQTWYKYQGERKREERKHTRVPTCTRAHTGPY